MVNLSDRLKPRRGWLQFVSILGTSAYELYVLRVSERPEMWRSEIVAAIDRLRDYRQWQSLACNFKPVTLNQNQESRLKLLGRTAV